MQVIEAQRASIPEPRDHLHIDHERKCPGATGSATIFSLTVTTAGDDLAIGEFGIASSTEVAAVRFAPVSAQTNPKAPGLPVVKDDGPAPVMDHQSGPASCPDGLAEPQSYDYLDCTMPPSGTPSKDWPVIYVAGSALTIDQAVFFSQTDMPGAQLTAAVIGGQTLTPGSTPLTSTQANGACEMSASHLKFEGTLPAQPGVDTLTVTWTIASGGTSTVVGVSKHQLYVTAAPCAQRQGTPDANVPPYATMLDLGTRAAAGQTSPRAVFNAIWTKFATRDIAHPVLDPARRARPHLAAKKTRTSTETITGLSDTERLRFGARCNGDRAAAEGAAVCAAAELSRAVRRSGQPGSVPLTRRSGAEWQR